MRLSSITRLLCAASLHTNVWRRDIMLCALHAYVWGHLQGNGCCWLLPLDWDGYPSDRSASVSNITCYIRKSVELKQGQCGASQHGHLLTYVIELPSKHVELSSDVLSAFLSLEESIVQAFTPDGDLQQLGETLVVVGIGSNQTAEENCVKISKEKKREKLIEQEIWLIRIVLELDWN